MYGQMAGLSRCWNIASYKCARAPGVFSGIFGLTGTGECMTFHHRGLAPTLNDLAFAKVNTGIVPVFLTVCRGTTLIDLSKVLNGALNE